MRTKFRETQTGVAVGIGPCSQRNSESVVVNLIGALTKRSVCIVRGTQSDSNSIKSISHLAKATITRTIGRGDMRPSGGESGTGDPSYWSVWAMMNELVVAPLIFIYLPVRKSSMADGNSCQSGVQQSLTLARHQSLSDHSLTLWIAYLAWINNVTALSELS